jgi:hypothetical protein
MRPLVPAWRGVTVASAVMSNGDALFAHGQTGSVSFDGDYVTIERKGLRARAMAGGKGRRIPVSSISHVQWQQPGFGRNGWISFVLGQDIARRGDRLQMQDAAHDEFSVMVTKKQAPAFEEIRDAVESAITDISRPVQVSSGESPAAQLKQLADLHAAGVVTDEEFAAKKADLLGRM